MKNQTLTANNPAPHNIQYLPEIDSIRTIAVLMTLLAHFWPVEIPYMWYGVPIFFTISGFLITTILLKSVKSDPGISKLKLTRNFVIRRTLRLFPLYFAFLLLFLVLRNYLFMWKDEFTPYFFAYVPNYYIYKFGSESAGSFAHLWSLGIEEQFYLFWPWVLLFAPARFQVPIIISLIFISFTFVFFNYQDKRIGAFPFAHFHTLGVGALLGYWFVEGNSVLDWLKKKRFLLFWISLIHLIVVLIFFKEGIRMWHLYREVSLSICTFSIVNASIFGWKGFIGHLTRNRTIQYIGAISYGIYLFHMPVPPILRAVMAKVSPAFQFSPYVFVFVCIAVTVGLAALSFKFFETPILKLKRHFNY